MRHGQGLPTISGLFMHQGGSAPVHASPPASWSRRLTRSSTIAVTNVSRRAGHLAAPTCCFRPELAFSTATLSNSSVAAIPRVGDHSPPALPPFCDGLQQVDFRARSTQSRKVLVATRYRECRADGFLRGAASNGRPTGVNGPVISTAAPPDSPEPARDTSDAPADGPGPDRSCKGATSLVARWSRAPRR